MEDERDEVFFTGISSLDSNWNGSDDDDRKGGV
jgi:hypothetical protein